MMMNSSLMPFPVTMELNMSERLVAIRLMPETKARFMKQGTYGDTADTVMRVLLDRIETCRCRPLRRVTT
jgi:hypothetical protein